MPRRQSIGKRQCKRALGQASSSPQRPITNFLQPLAELGEDIEDDDAGFILPRTQSGTKRKGTIPIATYSKKKKMTLKSSLGRSLFATEGTEENHEATKEENREAKKENSSPTSPNDRPKESPRPFGFNSSSRLSSGSNSEQKKNQFEPNNHRSYLPRSLYSPRLSTSRSRQDGIRNLGNSCYLSAVLQLLLSLKPLTAVLSHPLLKAFVPEKARLYHALRLIRKSRKNDFGGSFDPSNFRDVISSYTRCFSRNRQEDAHEFLGAVLGILEEEFQKADVIKQEWCEEDPLESFNFEVAHVLCCLKCGHTSCTTEPFRDLSVSLTTIDSPLPPSPVSPSPFSSPSLFSSSPSSPPFSSSSSSSPSSTSSSSATLASTLTSPSPSSPFSPSFEDHLSLWDSPRSSEKAAESPKIPPSLSASLLQDLEAFGETPPLIPDKSPTPKKYLLLSDLLLSFFSPETVERRCDECGGEAATLRRCVRKAPAVLMLHLKRFTHFGEDGDRGFFSASPLRKLRTPVLFESIIHLEQEDVKTKETVKIRYRLQSFISHRGTQASVGHYVCTVKNEENCGPHGSSSFYRSGQDANPPNFLDWTCFDDSRVNQLKTDAALGGENQKDAYILCYLRDPLPS